MPTTMRSRPSVFYPSHLALYRQCPERYHHKYLERRRVEEGFSPALAKGNAVHTILAECLEAFRCRGAFPADLRERVEYYLPRPPYPSDRAWRADVEAALAQIDFGLLEFDQSARVLATERTLEFPYPGGPDCPPFVLRAKVDRVLQGADGALEHADYKTGGGLRVDWLQTVISRIVVRHVFRGDYPAVRSTTVFLAAQATRTEELTREQVRGAWREIKGIITAILGETEWRPERSALCEWCPFAGNGCSLDAETAAGAELAAWLDGVAD